VLKPYGRNPERHGEELGHLAAGDRDAAAHGVRRGHERRAQERRAAREVVAAVDRDRPVQAAVEVRDVVVLLVGSRNGRVVGDQADRPRRGPPGGRRR
jgi:hypothetical protein